MTGDFSVFDLYKKEGIGRFSDAMLMLVYGCYGVRQDQARFFAVASQIRREVVDVRKKGRRTTASADIHAIVAHTRHNSLCESIYIGIAALFRLPREERGDWAELLFGVVESEFCLNLRGVGGGTEFAMISESLRQRTDQCKILQGYESQKRIWLGINLRSMRLALGKAQKIRFTQKKLTQAMASFDRSAKEQIGCIYRVSIHAKEELCFSEQAVSGIENGNFQSEVLIASMAYTLSEGLIAAGILQTHVRTEMLKLRPDLFAGLLLGQSDRAV